MHWIPMDIEKQQKFIFESENDINTIFYSNKNKKSI